MTRPDLVPAMFGLSGWELLIILIVALLLFGRRLPDIMRGLGSSVKEFKKGIDEGTQPSTAPPPQAPPGAVAREATPVAPAKPADPQQPPKA